MDAKIGKYELLYIVHPDLESSIDKITDRVKGIIENRGGKVTYEENWGKRKLAYEIKKTDVGIYVLWYFEVKKDSLGKIERDLRLTEEIIRFILIVLEDKPKVKAGRKKETKEAVEEATEIKEEPKTEKPAKKAAPASKKTVSKKKEPAAEASEEERMKVLDEKLGALLGDEGDNEDVKGEVKK